LDVVQKAVNKPTTFKSLLKNIKFSLDFLKPMIEKIGEHNVELGLPDEEVKYLVLDMEEGVKLVQKSSKVSKWNCMKSYYTDQLIELDGSLKRLFHILMVQGVRDAKETLILARKHQDQLTESARDAKETLVLAQKNTDQLIESAKDGKETLVLARENIDQLAASARDGKETLVLARKIKRMLKRIDCMVPACTNKGCSLYVSTYVLVHFKVYFLRVPIFSLMGCFSLFICFEHLSIFPSVSLNINIDFFRKNKKSQREQSFKGEQKRRKKSYFGDIQLQSFKACRVEDCYQEFQSRRKNW
jgi:hypothetical protein